MSGKGNDLTLQPSRRAADPPSPQALRQAIRLFIENAYGQLPPSHALKFVPADGDFDVTEWLMSDRVERTPPGVPFQKVKSFALRIGSASYRHMKLRVSRPGNRPIFIFTVDSHDAFLEADPGSPDYEGLKELKSLNAATVSKITSAWDAAGLSTERSFLRNEIRIAKASGTPEAT